MENYNTGLKSEWYQNSVKKVEEINKRKQRGSFIRFSQKVHPFRIDEIWFNPETEEKIFIEHLQNEDPRIYERVK